MLKTIRKKGKRKEEKKIILKLFRPKLIDKTIFMATT